MTLTKREKEILCIMPTESWVSQLQIGTSKSVMSKLCSAGFVKKKIVDNPSRDPRMGHVYKKINK
jgi:hypothetical protein